eukprot:Nitzschia sp. Nitz4//scaffold47_size129522//80357//81778//NITZ4_003557-RA/size129522-processed-gene-0.45-mRNA-1//-1//CDS//3329552818//4668//frame0
MSATGPNPESFPSEYGSLQDELDKIFASKLVEKYSPEALETLTRDLDSWKHTAILDDTPKVGDVLPDFALQDETGNIVSSVDLRAQGPVVIMFFRGSWCSLDHHTLRMFRKYTPHLRARGASVVAISGQKQTEVQRIALEGSLNYPLLSDLGHEYAQELGIAFVLSDKMKHLYESFGVDFRKVNDEDTGILPIPATFVIEPDGRIVYSHVEVDFTKRAEPVDILNALPPLKSSRKQSLSNRLEMEYTKLQDKWNDRRTQAFKDAVRAALADGVERNALHLGDRAPDFQLQDRDGLLVESRKLRKQGPLVVMFNLGNKSPLCKLQVTLMQKHLSKFTAKGASVLAISPGEESSGSFQISTVNSSTMPILMDTSDNTVVKQFRLMCKLPGYIAGLNREELTEFPMAATYVIAPSGEIIYSFVSVDPTKRPEPLTVLQNIPTEFQHHASLKWGPFSLIANRRLTPNVRPKKRGRKE